MNLPELERLAFGRDYYPTLDHMFFPANLKDLTLGSAFDIGTEKIHWPKDLQSLTFGSFFNQDIELLTLPTSLRSLTFGTHFNQPVVKVNWPGCLQNLTFGHFFNQQMAGLGFLLLQHFYHLVLLYLKSLEIQRKSRSDFWLDVFFGRYSYLYFDHDSIWL